MNKQELIKKVSDETGLSKREAAAAIEETFAAIIGAVAAKHSVNIQGFGTFDVKVRQAHAGVNPRTREPVEVPAKTIPVFKPGKAMRDACMNREESIS